MIDTDKIRDSVLEFFDSWPSRDIVTIKRVNDCLFFVIGDALTAVPQNGFPDWLAAVVRW
jgi:hypothetical protein